MKPCLAAQWTTVNLTEFDSLALFYEDMQDDPSFIYEKMDRKLWVVRSAYNTGVRECNAAAVREGQCPAILGGNSPFGDEWDKINRELESFFEVLYLKHADNDQISLFVLGKMNEKTGAYRITNQIYARPGTFFHG